MITGIGYFSDQVEEIRSQWGLRMYGFFLSLIHSLTYLFWSKDGSGIHKLFEGDVQVCWSVFQNCEISRPFFSAHIGSLLVAYLFFSLFTALLFLNERRTKLAYWSLAFLTAVKFFIFIQDYRMMGNYHYMPFVATLFYLLIPHKVQFGKLILVGFYLSAGSIKFNSDWLTGFALTRAPIITGKLLEWACAYVIVLETCIVPLLLSRSKWIFWFAFSQLFLFHLFSFHIVGFFYPCVMFLLLSLFVLERLWPERSLSVASRRWGYGALFLFAIAQVYPAIAYPESAVTAEGRILSLNMLDGRAVCENKMILRYQNQTYEKKILMPNYQLRVRCDPGIYYYHLKALCRDLLQEEDFIDLDFYMVGKRMTDSDWKIEMKNLNFCQNTPKLSWLGKVETSE
jgi:hypothetical protein